MAALSSHTAFHSCKFSKLQFHRNSQLGSCLDLNVAYLKHGTFCHCFVLFEMWNNVISVWNSHSGPYKNSKVSSYIVDFVFHIKKTKRGSIIKIHSSLTLTQVVEHTSHLISIQNCRNRNRIFEKNILFCYAREEKHLFIL